MVGTRRPFRRFARRVLRMERTLFWRRLLVFGLPQPPRFRSAARLHGARGEATGEEAAEDGSCSAQRVGTTACLFSSIRRVLPARHKLAVALHLVREACANSTMYQMLSTKLPLCMSDSIIQKVGSRCEQTM